MNYKILPSFLYNFIKIPNNLESYLPTKDNNFFFNDGHGWKYNNTCDFFTEEGLDWFREKGITIRKECLLFKLENDKCGIHTDAPVEYSFNFILKGKGEMHWIDVTNNEPIWNIVDKNKDVQLKRKSINQVVGWKDSSNNKIIDIWNDETDRIALARVNVPHRIISKSSETRICLALRTTKDCIRSFDEVVKLF